MSTLGTRGPVGLKRRVKRVVLRSRGDLRSITFGSAPAIHAHVPDDMVWNVCRELILCRIYEPDQIRIGAASAVVVDAGAHVGIFSLLASARGARVVAIEPDPSNYRVLELNVATNGLGDRIETIHGGLWSEAGSFVYAKGADSASGTLSIEDAVRDDITVPAVTLDSILEAFEAVDLLKLDIEGAEVAVLTSSSQLCRVRAIAAELHFSPDSDEAAQVRDLLEREGFAVWIVPERRLYSLEMFRRAVAQRRALRGLPFTKLLLIPYFLLHTIARHNPGPDELPTLYAVRASDPASTPRRITFSRSSAHNAAGSSIRP